MFLVALAVLLSALSCLITWLVARRLGDPREGLLHQKWVSSMAGWAAALPILGSIGSAYAIGGLGFAAFMTVVTIVGCAVASTRGQAQAARS